VRVALGFAATSGDALLDSSTTFFNSNPSEETVRYRTIPNPNAPNDAEKRIRQHAVNGAFESYRENECDENILRRSANEFEGFIARLMEGLYKLREALILADSVNLIALFSDITTQLVTLTGELRDYLLNVKFTILFRVLTMTACSVLPRRFFKNINTCNLLDLKLDVSTLSISKYFSKANPAMVTAFCYLEIFLLL
jgi:hypothetical protein